MHSADHDPTDMAINHCPAPAPTGATDHAAAYAKAAGAADAAAASIKAFAAAISDVPLQRWQNDLLTALMKKEPHCVLLSTPGRGSERAARAAAAWADLLPATPTAPTKGGE